MSDYRVSQIGDFAESIAEGYFPNSKVEPSKIASIKEIRFAFNHYGDAFDGVLEHKNSRYFIYINLNRVENASSSRGRFTFAHELGHYFIDEHRNALKNGKSPSHGSNAEYQSRNPVEMEADLFASSLLMPKSRFLKKAKNLGTGWSAIDQLCREFGTSRTSTAIRFANLSDKPMAIVKWDQSGYAWKWLSSNFLDASLRKTIEGSDCVAHGSATNMALNGEQTPACGFFRSGSVVSSWFPFVSPGSSRDDILVEEAVSLGRFGVMTLLYPESGTLSNRRY